VTESVFSLVRDPFASIPAAFCPFRYRIFCAGYAYPVIRDRRDESPLQIQLVVRETQDDPVRAAGPIDAQLLRGGTTLDFCFPKPLTDPWPS
jgi:hypothetical protein